MARATGLNFSLFDVASCPLAYHSMYNTFFMDFPVSSFVSNSSWLIAKGVDLAVACDDFPGFVMEIICIFHSGYFDCRDAFRTVLDS